MSRSVYYIDNGEVDPCKEAKKHYDELHKSLEPVYGPCIVRHYSKCSLEDVQRLQPLAVILSGSGTPWERFIRNNWGPEFSVIRHASIPILGICAGHQIIGMAYSARRESGCSPMRRLRPGEEDRCVGTHLEEYFVEKGCLPVRILKRDPIFSGIGDVAYVDENHYCEIKELPPEFDLLASTEECRIQAIRHRKRPLYGVQFHPQIYSLEHPDGKKILHNFLEIARHWRETQ